MWKAAMVATEQIVCASTAIQEGELRGFSLHGREIMLGRVDGRCHAVGAKCPHAGGPLAEGVLHGTTVICPWHKAAFDLVSGHRREPPAMDDLPYYPVREAEGVIRVELTPKQTRPPLPNLSSGRNRRCFLILGAGAAGVSAAQCLREEGFTGRIVMISKEARLPYDRTRLSKYDLSGREGSEKTPLLDADFYERQRIERRQGLVTGIDLRAKRVNLAGGTELSYDAALIALGSEPRPLPFPGSELPGVFVLRRPEDTEAIVAAARHARRVVVIGAGFIAMEAAASLRERGLEVTIAAPDKAPLASRLGAEIGHAFQELHERKGVTFRLGMRVAAIEGDGWVRQVALQDGSVLPADLVVAGLGVTPMTAPVRTITLLDDGGIPVDAHLRVSDDLYAAGDLAAFPLTSGEGLVRVEHWRVAQQHGRVAALNMLGRRQAYEAVPVFWTILYHQRLDYLGHAADWDEIVIDGNPEELDFLAMYVRQGQVAAIAGWNRDRQIAEALALLTERRMWAPNVLQQQLSRI